MGQVVIEAILPESETRFRAMIDAISVMIRRSAPDKLCTYVNTRWIQFTGRAMNQELGNGWSAAVHPEDFHEYLQKFSSAFDQRRSFSAEYRVRHCSGDYRWIQDHGAPLFDSGGEFLGFVDTCVDIHDSKLAHEESHRSRDELLRKQEDLRSALEYLESMMGSLGEAVYTLDTAGLVSYANLAMEEIFGWSRSEMIGRRMHEMIHYKHADGTPFPAEECPNYYLLPQSEALLRNREDLFVRKDGSFVNVLYNSSPIRSGRGEFMGRIVVLQDITAQRMAEEKIHRSEEWFKSIIDSSQDGIISINGAGEIVLFNPAAERIFGYRANEVEGQKIDVLMTEHHAHEQHECLQRYERAPDPAVIGQCRVIEAKRKNGAIFSAEISLGETTGADEIRYTTFVRDVSERTRIQSELQTRARRESAVAELSRRALAVNDLRLFMTEACHLVRQNIGTQFASVFELLHPGQHFALIAGAGWEESLIGKATIPAGTESQAGYTVMRDIPVTCGDTRQETRFRRPDLLRDHGILSSVSAVIPGVARSFGVLSAGALTPRSFSGTDVQFLQAVAGVIGEAVERFKTLEALKASREELRALALRLQAAREEERASLAREIHDEIDGSLTALKMELALLPDKAAKDASLFLEKLKSMSALIESTSARMHEIVTGLRPVVLDKFGLVAAMEWQLSEFEQRSGIEVARDLPEEDLGLAPDQSIALFRIFQEALTNVLRHAEATRVTVRLKRRNGLTLEISDNGKGIDEKALQTRTTLGLVGMRERALGLGGTLEIQPAPERGTRIVINIPR